MPTDVTHAQLAAEYWARVDASRRKRPVEDRDDDQDEPVSELERLVANGDPAALDLVLATLRIAPDDAFAVVFVGTGLLTSLLEDYGPAFRRPMVRLLDREPRLREALHAVDPVLLDRPTRRALQTWLRREDP